MPPPQLPIPYPQDTLPWISYPLDTLPLEGDTLPEKGPYPPVNRQTPVKTLPSGNFVGVGTNFLFYVSHVTSVMNWYLWT